jgi:hypothetical protein
MSEEQEWVPCEKPAISDILKWTEPLWAAPSKPRGKPDKIGEQEITAELVAVAETLELRVLDVRKLSVEDVPLKVKAGDDIRRKRATLAQGECHKQVTIAS